MAKDVHTLRIDGKRYDYATAMADPVLKARYEFMSADPKGVKLAGLQKQLSRYTGRGGTDQTLIANFQRDIAAEEASRATYLQGPGSTAPDQGDITASVYNASTDPNRLGQLAEIKTNSNLPSSTLTQPDIQNGVPSPYAQSASYTGPSIVDFLNQSGQASDIGSRATLAQQHGISNYTGTAQQNTQLLGTLRGLKGGTGTNGIATSPASVSNITPQTGLGLTSPGVGTSTSVATGTSTSSAIESTIAASQTETDEQADALTSRLSDLVGDTAGQASELAKQEKKAGVEALNKQLTQVNNEIKTAIAERNALNVDQQGKPVTMASIIGGQAQINAVYDAKIFTLTAQANVLMGNIELAQENAQRAVDAKYGPILEEIKIREAQLALLQPKLNKEEKVRAELQAQALTEKRQAVEDQKAIEGALRSTLLDQMQKYPDAGISLNDTLEQANQKIIQNSRIYAETVGPSASSGGGGEGGSAGVASIPGTSANQEALGAFSLASSILNSGQIGRITGLQALNPFNMIPGAPNQLAKNQFEQLKALLALSNRSKLKGSGAISDFESKTLDRSGSALGRNLSPADFTKELKQVKGVLGSMAGIPQTVLVTNPANGAKESRTLTREDINSAITQGYLIEYQ